MDLGAEVSDLARDVIYFECDNNNSNLSGGAYYGLSALNMDSFHLTYIASLVYLPEEKA